MIALRDLPSPEDFGALITRGVSRILLVFEAKESRSRNQTFPIRLELEIPKNCHISLMSESDPPSYRWQLNRLFSKRHKFILTDFGSLRKLTGENEKKNPC